jgi:chemotaxis protein MotB
MVTYSDLVTLLLTFFVLLLSMANLDKLKFNAASESIKQAFGVLGVVDDASMSPPKFIQINAVQGDMVQRVYKKLKKDIARLNLDENIKLVKKRGAVVLRVNDTVLFDFGSSRIKPGAKPTLRKIAELLKSFPFHVRIEGHSDKDMVKGDNELANWDMSVRRSVSVVKFYIANDLFPANRMSAAGYGSQRPLVPNDTKENRALNRRVEFVLESVNTYEDELPYLIDVRDHLPF